MVGKALGWCDLRRWFSSRKHFAAVAVVLVVVLVSVYYCTCGVSRSIGESEEVADGQSQSIPMSPSPSGSPSPSKSPDAVQPATEKLASSSSITVNTLAQVNSSQPASSVKLGVYASDPSVGQPVALQVIDWSAFGSLVPGQSVNSSKVYLKNEGSVPVTLALSATGWAFQDSGGGSLSQSYQQYFVLSWNYDNRKIGVNETRGVTFTLSISPSIVNVATFSFRLVVTATY